MEHAGLRGLSRQDQRTIAALVRAHRHKLPTQVFDRLPRSTTKGPRLAVLLRLATLLHRSGATTALPPIAVTATADTLRLTFIGGWLDDHPLTAADLQLEAEDLRATKVAPCLKVADAAG